MLTGRGRQVSRSTGPAGTRGGGVAGPTGRCRDRRPSGAGRRRHHHPQGRTGAVETLRALRVTRRSAVKARSQAANQLHSLVVTALTRRAPSSVGCQQPGWSSSPRRCAPVRWTARGGGQPRPARAGPPPPGPQRRDRPARRPHRQADRHDRPELLARRGVGAQVATGLLVAAGDNPTRLASEAAFAARCGASPIEASWGKTVRHRRNRGGDRQANHAVWTSSSPGWPVTSAPAATSSGAPPKANPQGDHPLPQALPRTRGLPRRTSHSPPHHVTRP
jgi:Transposase IS116/IS110/IS902 family